MVEGWNDGMLEWWDVGMVEGWNDGMLECWNGGKVEWWKDGVLECWSIGWVEGSGILNLWDGGIINNEGYG